MEQTVARLSQEIRINGSKALAETSKQNDEKEALEIKCRILSKSEQTANENYYKMKAFYEATIEEHNEENKILANKLTSLKYTIGERDKVIKEQNEKLSIMAEEKQQTDLNHLLYSNQFIERQESDSLLNDLQQKLQICTNESVL